MHLISVQAGKPRTYGDPAKTSFDEREWKTGFFKEPMIGAVSIHKLGIDGDGQADLKVHGGVDKAICVYPSEHFAYWQETLGLNMQPGAFGENFSIKGATEVDVCVGDSYEIGDVVLQVTQPRQPCWKLARRWQTRNLTALVQQNGKTGWYFRVIKEGRIEAPNDLRLIDRPNRTWTIERCNQVMHHIKSDLVQASALAQIRELSESWQSTLLKRIKGSKSSSEKERLGN